MVIAVGDINQAFCVDGNSERRLKFPPFASILSEFHQGRPDFLVFTSVDDQNCEGTVFDWFSLYRDGHLVFSVHFRCVIHRVFSIALEEQKDRIDRINFILKQILIMFYLLTSC